MITLPDDLLAECVEDLARLRWERSTSLGSFDWNLIRADVRATFRTLAHADIEDVLLVTGPAIEAAVRAEAQR